MLVTEAPVFLAHACLIQQKQTLTKYDLFRSQSVDKCEVAPSDHKPLLCVCVWCYLCIHASSILCEADTAVPKPICQSGHERAEERVEAVHV